MDNREKHKILTVYFEKINESELYSTCISLYVNPSPYLYFSYLFSHNYAKLCWGDEYLTRLEEMAVYEEPLLFIKQWFKIN